MTLIKKFGGVNNRALISDMIEIDGLYETCVFKVFGLFLC